MVESVSKKWSNRGVERAAERAREGGRWREDEEGGGRRPGDGDRGPGRARKGRSEEHTSELQSPC